VLRPVSREQPNSDFSCSTSTHCLLRGEVLVEAGEVCEEIEFWGVPLDPPGYTLCQTIFGGGWAKKAACSVFPRGYVSFLRRSIIWYLIDSLYGRRCMFGTYKKFRKSQALKP
jgi:hypothetical protein